MVFSLNYIMFQRLEKYVVFAGFFDNFIFVEMDLSLSQLLSYIPSSIRDTPPPSWSSSTYIAFCFVTEFDQGHLLTIYLELSTGTQWTHLWVHNRRQFFFHSQNLLVVSSS